MAVFEVRKYPDPVVREATQPVERVDGETKALIKNMIETMYHAPGVGLAANQIGVQRSIAVVEIDDKPHAIINPKIIWLSEETDVDEEGCLSLTPDVHIPIERPKKIRVRALNERGRKWEINAEGLLARVIQHEIDHLNGVLIIDRATEEVRKQALQDMASLFRDE